MSVPLLKDETLSLIISTFLLLDKEAIIDGNKYTPMTLN